MTFKTFQKILKKSIIATSTVSLIAGMLAIGSCATVPLTTLQDHTMFISLGQRSTWDHLILDRRTEYFTTFGKRVRLINEATECATLRIDDLDLALWRLQRQSTWQLPLRTQDLGSYLRLERMLRRCSRTRLYPFQSTTRFSSNQYRTEWNVPKQNYPTRFLPKDLPEIPLRKPIKKKKKDWEQAWIPRSTGRTRATTRTMGRNYNSSSTTNRANGRGPTTSSTTGGSRKPASGSVQKL